MSELKTLLDPISKFIATLDASDPKRCEQALNAQFAPSSDAVKKIREAAFAALAAGTLCNRGEPNLKYSRFEKPEANPGGCSIDAVYMDDVAGPAHTHTNGEFCLCFADRGEATFEDRRDTWIVMAKGSRRFPTVKNGRMLILYWLPAGAVAWG